MVNLRILQTSFQSHWFASTSSFHPLLAKNSEAEDNTPPTLSDEELLLACRAYLQRKNNSRNWTKFEKRKALRNRQQEFQKESLSGFFWEDPTELKYYQQNINASLALVLSESASKEEDTTKTFMDDDDDYLDKDDKSARITATTQLEQVSFDFLGRDENDNLVQAAREFSSFPTRPPESRINRSEAAKRRWKDPEWKAKWYEKRWGDKPRRRRSARYKQRLEALTLDFLSSQEFVNMTEAEIQEAAEFYARANQKRIESRKKTLKKRREALQSPRSDEHIPLDAFSWDKDPKALQEARRLRSERARKAYQTRLKNSNTTSTASARKEQGRPKKKIVPKGSTPMDALLRIEADLDGEKLPSVEDLEIISKPVKLGKRKDLVKRLLWENFGLRGKCIPGPDGNPDNLQFVTTCSVEDLMMFTIRKVRENGEAKDR